MPLVAFKKKGKTNRDKSFRKREVDDVEAVDAEAVAALRPGLDEATTEMHGEEESNGPPLQRRKVDGGGKNKLVGSSSVSGNSSDGNDKLNSLVYKPYESSKSTEQTYKGDAEIVYRQDQTEEDRDSRAQRERALQEKEKIGDDEDTGYNGKTLYRGKAAYRSFVEVNEAEAISRNKITGTQGPIRAPAFLRATARFDYQPNVCKDYKETGTCGYGDSCIFMHDRTDYKSGWQLEQDWNKEQAAKKKRLEDALVNFTESTKPVDGNAGESVSEDNGEEELPFACFICRDSFKNPVVTNCGHYFCGKCIINYGKGTPNANKCPVCSKQTFGVFNMASKLMEKIADRNKESTSSEVNTSNLLKRKGVWEEVN